MDKRTLRLADALFALVLVLLLSSSALGAQGKEKVRVACVGNSITFGASLDNTARDSYPSVLGQMLGKEYDVRNFGVSGTTLVSKGDHPYIETSAYKNALSFVPDIVLIKLGTNDSKPQNWKHEDIFERDLQSLVDSFKEAAPSSRIILCFPASCYAVGKSIRDSVIVYGVIPHIRRVAERNGLELADFHYATSRMENHFPDTIHPDREGAAVIAASAYKAITGNEIDFSLQQFPGVKSKWRGYDKYDFQFGGRDAIVVAPAKPLPDNLWIWRPAFFGAFPAVDIAMLALGYYVAYYDVTFLYGSPRSLDMGDKFYDAMIKYYGLSDKVILEGFSRGGLFAINWAERNPEKVSCIYLDAPVCDVFSWPGRERDTLWKEFLDEWNLTEDDMASFKDNPIDHLKALAKNKIHIVGVAGDSDKTVPYADNLEILAAKYKKMGGRIDVILKPGCDHHPHSLDAPAPIVKLILN